MWGREGMHVCLRRVVTASNARRRCAEAPSFPQSQLAWRTTRPEYSHQSRPSMWRAKSVFQAVAAGAGSAVSNRVRLQTRAHEL